MKVLVTGASGFIGRCLCEALIKNGVDVSAVVRNPLKDIKGAKLIIKDLKPNINLQEVLREIDVVIHLAGRTHVMKELSPSSSDAYHKVNVEITKVLAEQSALSGVKRFIFISSIGDNGNQSDIPFNELHAPKPTEHYTLSKKVAEEELRKIAQVTDLEMVIIRPPLVYGKGVKASFRKLIKLSKIKIPLPFGAIKNKRSLIYIENLVDFIMVCTWHPNAANETFLISDGDDVSTTDIIRGIAHDRKVYLIPMPQPWIKYIFNLLGKKVAYTKLCGSLQADITKATTLLGWKPPYNFKQAITKTMSGDWI